MSRDQIDAEIAKAWGVWANVTQLTFQQKRSGKVHVDIRCVF